MTRIESVIGVGTTTSDAAPEVGSLLLLLLLVSITAGFGGFTLSLSSASSNALTALLESTAALRRVGLEREAKTGVVPRGWRLAGVGRGSKAWKEPALRYWSHILTTCAVP